MMFSAFSRFGFLRFSGAKPRPQVFFESLGQQMDKAFDTSGLNQQALTPLAEKFALSYHLARQEWHVVKAGQQRNVNVVTDLLPLREEDFMAIPGAHDTISKRQKRLAATALLPGGATYTNISSMLSAVLGSSFLGLRVVQTSERATNLPTSVFTNPQIESKFLRLNVPLGVTSLSVVSAAGTSPPLVTIAANGLASSTVITYLYMKISVGGVLTSSSTNVKFTYSFNNGTTTLGTLTASPNGVVIPGIGVTVTFPTGTYYGPGGSQNIYNATITPQLIGYQNIDPTIPVTDVLSIGDVVTVQGESKLLGEAITVAGLFPADGSILATPEYYGTTQVTTFFMGTFGNSHDVGSTVTTMLFPRWSSTQSFLYIELTASAASDPIIRSQVDTVMEKVARGWCAWSVVADIGGSIGPFALSSTPLGTATIGNLSA